MPVIDSPQQIHEVLFSEQLPKQEYIRGLKVLAEVIGDGFDAFKGQTQETTKLLNELLNVSPTDIPTTLILEQGEEFIRKSIGTESIEGDTKESLAERKRQKQFEYLHSWNLLMGILKQFRDARIIEGLAAFHNERMKRAEALGYKPDVVEVQEHPENYIVEHRICGKDTIIFCYDPRTHSAQIEEIKKELAFLWNTIGNKERDIPRTIRVFMLDKPFRSYAIMTFPESTEIVLSLHNKDNMAVARHEMIHTIFSAEGGGRPLLQEFTEGCAARLARSFSGKSDMENFPNVVVWKRLLSKIFTDKPDLKIASHTQVLDEAKRMGVNLTDDDKELYYLVGYAVMDAVLLSQKWKTHSMDCVARGKNPYTLLYKMNSDLTPDKFFASGKFRRNEKFSTREAIQYILEKNGFDYKEIMTHVAWFLDQYGKGAQL